MKKLDNIIYIVIKTLGIIAITIISYFIISTTINLMHKIDFLEILTDLSIYKIFYNIIDKMFVPVTFIIFIIAIPYLIIFIISIIILIIKYIKFHNMNFYFIFVLKERITNYSFQYILFMRECN